MDVDRAAGRIPDEAHLAGDPSQRAVAATLNRGQRTPRRTITLSLVVFAVSVAALVAFDVTSAGQRSMLDLQIYRWGGLLGLHSGALYGSHFPHHHLLFTYPPMAALIFAALSAVPVSALKWLVTAGSVLSLAATLWLTWGMLGYRRSAGRVAATLAATGVALWLGPVQQTLGFGQVNLMLMLIIVADLRLPDTAWAKGAGVGLAAGFKLTPLIFIPYLLLTRRFRAAGVASATFALTIAGSLILLPRQSRQFWFGALFLNSGRTGNNAYVGNQSLNGTAVRLLGSVPAARPYWVALSVAVGATGLLLAAWWARRGHEMTGILTCALTGLLISPISWSHHWVWVAPALVVAADLALRLEAPLPWPIRSRPDTARLTSRSRWQRWRRWAFWSGVAALAAAFFALPQALVPASVVQGSGAHGTQLLTGNLYVIAGLATLCLAGVALVMRDGRRTS